MHPRLFTVSAALLLLGLAATPSRAAVPTVISFQGRLTTAAGAPVADTTSQTLTFHLYDAPTGGNLLWSQTSTGVAVTGGVFTALLDVSTGFTGSNTLDTVLGGTPYIEVQAGSDPPMTPRLPFTSSPYALSARTAGTALTIPYSGITGAPGFLNSLSNLTFAAGSPSALQPAVVAVAGTPNDAVVLTGGGSRLDVVDISGATPVLLGGKSLPSPCTDVAVSGNYAFLGVGGKLAVYDISNPAAITQTNGGQTSQSPGGNALAVQGSYLYVGDSGRLWVEDSNPAGPSVLSFITLGVSTTALAVSGTYAYVVSSAGGVLKVVNVANPRVPVVVGSVATDLQPKAVAVRGSTVFVACGGSPSLEAFDVSNPAAPALISKITFSDAPVGMALLGQYAYVETTSSVIPVDISDPAAMTAGLATDISPTTPLLAITTVGSHVAVTTRNSIQRVDPIPTLRVQANLTVDGYVGIGVKDPGYPLDVSGDINARGTVRANGVALSSDVRLKQNIAGINGALDTVMAMRGVTYDWRTDEFPARRFPAGRQIGFIAQELETVLPELVSTDVDGYKSVAYQNVVPVLVEAVKTLKADNDAKSAQIAALEQRLKRLEERLNQPAGARHR